jgi:ribosomal protein S17E
VYHIWAKRRKRSAAAKITTDYLPVFITEYDTNSLLVIANQAANGKEDENEITFSQVFQLSGIGIEPEYGDNFLDVPLEENMTVEEAHEAGYPGRKTSSGQYSSSNVMEFSEL